MAGLGELSQTVMMLGQGFGGLIFSMLADKYGRKPVYIATLFGLSALCFGMAFSNGILVYIIIRFLIGGFQQVGFILPFGSIHSYWELMSIHWVCLGMCY